MDLVYKDKKQLKKCKELAKIFKKSCNYKNVEELNTVVILQYFRCGFPNALLVLEILKKGKKIKKQIKKLYIY